MKLYPLMPLVFIAAYLFVGISIFVNDPGTGLLGLGILAVFIALYFFAKKIQVAKAPELS
jgi:APA family basic amino acid/polyamine antiporter